MQARNSRIAGNGQEMWGHACKRCMKIIKMEDGTVRKYSESTCIKLHCSGDFKGYLMAGVTDGITCGHTRCSFRPVCMNPLLSSHHKFCPAHLHLQLQCFIRNCSQWAESGHISCIIPEHRAEESRQQASAPTAMAQLQSRLANAGTTDMPDQVHERPEGNIRNSRTTTSSESSPPTPTATPTSSIKASSMSRLWTHNEQLFVMCCGVITARATFYNAEGLAAVAVSFLII